MSEFIRGGGRDGTVVDVQSKGTVIWQKLQADTPRAIRGVMLLSLPNADSTIPSKSILLMSQQRIWISLPYTDEHAKIRCCYDIPEENRRSTRFTIGLHKIVQHKLLLSDPNSVKSKNAIFLMYGVFSIRSQKQDRFFVLPPRCRIQAGHFT